MSWRQEQIDMAIAQIGLTPKLMAATWDGIPAEVLPLIPRLEDMGTGFSLIGGTGCGKSSAQAVFVRQSVEQITRESANRAIRSFKEFVSDKAGWLAQRGLEDFKGYHSESAFLSEASCLLKCEYPNVVWLHWPDAALALQGSAVTGWKPGDARRVPYHPDRMKAADWLVLDDLGRERCKQDSYATSHLESVINFRDQHGKVTLWNSNLTVAALVDHFGAPIVDRLRGMAPFHGSEWLDLRSLR